MYQITEIQELPWFELPACRRLPDGTKQLPQEMLKNGQWDIKEHIDGLVQSCSNSSALAMELLQYCAQPSICEWNLMNIWDVIEKFVSKNKDHISFSNYLTHCGLVTQ